MPRLKSSSRSLPGPLVTTSGQVISGAGSPGQQVWTGSLLRSMSSPVSTTSCTGAFFTVPGRIAITVLARGSMSRASFRPLGGAGWRRKASNSPTSRSSPAVVRGSPPRVTPMATRLTVPNRLARAGMGERVPSGRITFSNSTAGPPVASRRVWISVISSTVDTGSVTRTSSPFASRTSMNSRRLR
jgi:hypothetical protein